MAPESRFLCLLLALQAAAKVPCSLKDIIYKDPKVPEGAPNGAWVMDSLQCQRSCETRVDCAFFSFVPSNLPGAGACWLLGQKAKAEKQEGVISGFKVCNKEASQVIDKCHTEQHQCPSHWTSGLGGFLCQKGQSRGACRHAAHGAFPSNDCEAQCSIGIVDIEEAHAELALKESIEKKDIDHPKVETDTKEHVESVTDSNILTTWLADHSRRGDSWDPRTVTLPTLEKPSRKELVRKIQDLWSDEIKGNEIFEIHVVKPFVNDFPGHPSLHLLVERHFDHSGPSRLTPVLLEVQDAEQRKWRVHWTKNSLTLPEAIKEANEMYEGHLEEAELGSKMKIVVYDHVLEHGLPTKVMPGNLMKMIVPKEHFKSLGGKLNGWTTSHGEPTGLLTDEMKKVFLTDTRAFDEIESLVEQAPEASLDGLKDNKIQECDAKEHQCPSHWSNEGESGGYHCRSGVSKGACRHAVHGPFPAVDCEVQCSIGSFEEEKPDPTVHLESKEDERLDDGFLTIHPCVSSHTSCPEEWSHKGLGGFLCHSNKGCRSAVHGPFPAEDCQAQCSIGDVDVAGGGDVAVPFNCLAKLSSWKTDWSDEKKRWCCENSVSGLVACETKDSSSGAIERCHTDLKTSCPREWYRPGADEGGFYCQDHGGCRSSADGPFPLESCKDQCYLGRATAGGWIPKPVYWDCHLHLETWESKWSKEKQSWCCAHSNGAHKVCAHITVTHKATCKAFTAGGIPCNFPFHWSGEKHYSCVVENGLMQGKPWCARVDGRWAECDCEEGASHSTSIEVSKTVTLHTGFEAVEPCHFADHSQCPSDWSTGNSGGYLCHSDKGCRPASQGPFPAEDCQAQCSIGSVYVPGGGDVAVPFDCLLHLQRWKTHWSNAKKRWCCEHTQEGQVACGAQDSSVSSGSLRLCPEHLKTSCPDEWYDPHTRFGGFYCHGDGATSGGCRGAAHGPFPLEDCKEQCYIGEVRIGGFLPKPLLWDCERHIDHWERHWTKEKQLWCCTHDRFAREVCGHITVSHKLVTSCDATTAGGVPCDFPYTWAGKQHYSCTVDDVQMGGQPWCIRVDGSWADCDCQGYGSHVISIDVTHVHKSYPHEDTHLGNVNEKLPWRPQGVVEGIHTAINCSSKEVNATQTKKQWCCQLSPDCIANASNLEFDCLAGLSEWEEGWSLEKKVWCWTSDGHHDLFDCEDGLKNAEHGWSTDKQDWCCRNKHLGCAPAFDCENDLETWETSWNLTKKKWCWNTAQKGYLHPFICEGTFAEQEKWPSEKQDWCCKNMHKGCMGSFNCQENYATWQVQWTAEKKHYCCEKEAKGCYDCNAGLANWERGWSEKKKTYCCQEDKKTCFSCLDIKAMSKWSAEHKGYCCSTQNVGCHDCSGDVRLFFGDKKEWCCENEGRCAKGLTPSSTTSTTNCPDAIDEDDPAYCNTPIGTWPEDKREYCCAHFKRGCPDKKFDCDVDLKTHEWAWSHKKKEWCCAHEHRGCPPPINCHTAPTSWTLEKRHFCCEEHHIGCDLYDCRDQTSPDTWTASRKDWCCRHEDIGCPIGEKPILPTYPYDCHKDINSWRENWHPAKKEYCCKKIEVGCEDHPLGEGGCGAICHWDSQQFSCGERIKYAASHRFANQKHACVAAHHLVAGECDHCGHCTVEMSGCYVFWHEENHHHITTHTETSVVHLGHHDAAPSSYDCNAGFEKWELNWDARQKAWCCEHAKKGCSRYQCDLDLVNFKQHWGAPKKVWCCEHEKLGCEAGLVWFDCVEQAENWEKVWAPEKKTWCCAQEQKGCPGWTWHPPHPSKGSGTVHVVHTTYTTHHVHHGGHWDVGFHHSWHHGGEWHDGQHPPASHIVHHEAHKADHFDCHAALANWEDAWSAPKKHWCWAHYKLGSPLLYDCHKGEAISWKTAKNDWCCSQMNICHGHPHQPRFDCNAALGNWERAWSPKKKDWCWQHEHKGGPPIAPVTPVAPPAAGSSWGAAGMLPAPALQKIVHQVHDRFDCEAALGNWEDAWSSAKKGWCWITKRKGGPEPFNCFTAATGWTDKKKSWCCEQHRDTCPDRRLSENIPEIVT